MANPKSSMPAAVEPPADWSRADLYDEDEPR